MEPKVSIIIPSYNAEKTISKCLDSIINQTYKNLEIIVINDGSKDNTFTEIKKYSDDERVIAINQNNQGVSETRNAGIATATGEYILFVDSDDWLEQKAIEELINTSKKNNVDVIRYNCFYEDKNKITIPSLYNLTNKRITKEEFGKYRIFEHFLLNSEPIKNFVMLLFIKKSVFDSNIRFKKELYMMEDVYFYLRLFGKIDDIYFLDLPLYHYCDNDSSATKSPDKYEKNIFGILDTNEVIKEHLLQNNIITNRIKELNGNHYRIICYYLYYIYRHFNKEILLNTIKKLRKKESFQDIIKNLSLKELSLYWKLVGISIKYNLLLITLVLFYIRKKRERRK